MQCQTRRASCEPRSKPAARLLLRQAGLCVAVRDSDLAALAEPPIPGIEDRGACEREESATARVRWRQSEALRPRQNKRKRGPFMSVDCRREGVPKNVCFARGAWPRSPTIWPAWRRSEAPCRFATASAMAESFRRQDGTRFDSGHRARHLASGIAHFLHDLARREHPPPSARLVPIF